MLTDKAKEDFLNYYWENYIGKTRCISKKKETEEFFDSLIPPLKTALIAEWFDSMDIFLWVYRSDSGYWATYVERKAKYDTREEALAKVIEFANVMYNN